ncbi:Uncharacterised protein [Legionella steigerwaltii]|uniref:Uncharacterized protein n=1 Tax=Legionella steigerwaltii TaxID=460 RepID=A0A378LAW2_9GAMM|nr:hypothetical protein [Legionella steigerwaltii]KTD71689.1 hypothetical protein Lstg_2897 [Legionella steigerwaltii]STY23857.1 Uncharacterised protein [Legionella steigerwaltii]
MAGEPDEFEDTGKISITHVQMMHRPISDDFLTFVETNQIKNDKNKDFRVSHTKDEIAASQFAVAQYIIKHPDTAVVLEGLSHELSAELINPDDPVVQEVRKHFDHTTFDKDFIELTPEQKKLLADKFGAMVVLYVGLLDKIYPSIRPETAKVLHQAIKDIGDDYERLRDVADDFQKIRESEALTLSVEAAEKSNKTAVLLLYGAEHRFDLAAELLDDARLTLTEPVDCQIVVKPKDFMSVTTAHNTFSMWNHSKFSQNKLDIGSDKLKNFKDSKDEFEKELPEEDKKSNLKGF